MVYFPQTLKLYFKIGFIWLDFFLVSSFFKKRLEIDAFGNRIAAKIQFWYRIFQNWILKVSFRIIWYILTNFTSFCCEFQFIVYKNTYFQSISIVIPKFQIYHFLCFDDGKIYANEKFIFECGLFSFKFKAVFYKIHLFCFFLVASVYKVELLHSATNFDQLGTNQNLSRSIHPIIISHLIGPT